MQQPKEITHGDPASTREAGRSRAIVILLGVAVFTIVIATWEILTRTELIPSILLPPPSKIIVGLSGLIFEPWFPKHFYATLVETVGGFALGASVAIVMGVLLSSFSTLKEIAMPYVVALQVVPKIALAPIFITWFGIGINSKILMAAAISYFPVLINTMLGFDSVSRDALLLMRSLRASRWQVIRKLSLPTAVPFILAGLETAITLSLAGVIATEFIAAQAGLGLLVITFNFDFKMPMVFAVIAVLSMMGLVLYQLTRSFFHRVIARGRPGLSSRTF
jgi:NitT/TauT family transport system permease protein